MSAYPPQVWTNAPPSNGHTDSQPQPAKRKSRFADAATAPAPPNTYTTPAPQAIHNAQQQAQPPQPAKRSRWGAAPAVSANPAIPTATQSQLDLYRKQAQVELLTKQVMMPSIVLQSPEYLSRPRSPSPPPVYDRNGQRTNTREQRFVERLQRERDTLITEIQALNPMYRPSAAARSGGKSSNKIVKKMYIPVKQHPEYNFIGQIIGPRGNTQKKLEAETGCKIAIRGKGSVKEGKAKIGDGTDDDELHVLVTGTDPVQIERAAEQIEKLLTPTPDELNDHKNKQLRELAAINGTLREDMVCRLCGKIGHRNSNCPERRGAEWKPADVRCGICGQTSHVTRDCPNKNSQANTALDADYQSFMAEITGQPQAAPAPSSKPPTSQQSGAAPGGRAAPYVHPSRMRQVDQTPHNEPPPQQQSPSSYGGQPQYGNRSSQYNSSPSQQQPHYQQHQPQQSYNYAPPSQSSAQYLPYVSPSAATQPQAYQPYQPPTPQQAYPPASSQQYPPPPDHNASYPPQQQQYPPQYPPAANQYPPANHYPPSNQYPPVQSQYPPANTYPPQQQYPPPPAQSGSYPNQYPPKT